MQKFQLLDCTLRDGAYIVDSKFGSVAMKGIIGKLQEANVDIIECGWLKDKPHTEGTSFYHVPDDILPYLGKKKEGILYVAMIDWNRYNVDALPPYDGRTIDAVRVVFPYGKHKEGIAIGQEIRKKGYLVCYQAANTLAYKNEDLIALAEEINKTDAVSLSVVDTFGAMYEDDIDRMVTCLNDHLRPEINLGIHTHNNQQMAFALSLHFIDILKNTERGVMVDSSLCGMGRGAGNATTELVANYMNKKCGCHYDMDAIMDAIDVYMQYYQENFEWGYSTAYSIAGMYCCHVNNIAYLLKNHRCSAKDMRNVIESLSPEDRKQYDYDLLEQKYLEIQNQYKEDENVINRLKQELTGKEVLLIAPGKSAIKREDKIKEYIDIHKPIVFGVNAVVSDYAFDHVFFVNPARYEYAKNKLSDNFKNLSKVILSNIKNEADENEVIVGFNTAIKRGWEHYDNAVICLLRLLDKLGVERVSIAGFDGFKHKYNESYADAYLPSLNPDDKWDELNEEIKSMYSDFKNHAVNCRSIYFITESYFNN